MSRDAELEKLTRILRDYPEVQEVTDIPSGVSTKRYLPEKDEHTWWVTDLWTGKRIRSIDPVSKATFTFTMEYCVGVPPNPKTDPIDSWGREEYVGGELPTPWMPSLLERFHYWLQERVWGPLEKVEKNV